MSNSNFRKIDAAELGLIVRLSRDLRNWSQEQLAEISKLSVRTIQRVENGISANFDTRRSLALAFDVKDIDYFNNPINIPTPESIEEDKKMLEKDYLTLNTEIIKNTKKFMYIVSKSTADYFFSEDLPHEVKLIGANVIDIMRDYRDIFNLYTEVQKLEVNKTFQDLFLTIEDYGYSIVISERDTVVKLTVADSALPVRLLYLGIFKKGSEPKQFLVPKRISFDF